MITTFKDYPSNGGATFNAIAYGNILTVQKTNPDGTFTKHNVKIIADDSVIYKIQKTQIRAAGGAAGLLSWLNGFTSWTDYMSSHASKIYNMACDYVRPAKV